MVESSHSETLQTCHRVSTTHATDSEYLQPCETRHHLRKRASPSQTAACGHYDVSRNGIICHRVWAGWREPPTHQKDICNGDKCHHMDLSLHGAHRDDKYKSSSKSTAQYSGLHEGMSDLLTLTERLQPLKVNIISSI